MILILNVIKFIHRFDKCRKWRGFKTQPEEWIKANAYCISYKLNGLSLMSCCQPLLLFCHLMQQWLDVLSVCVDDADDLHTTLVWGDRLNSFGVMWYHTSLGRSSVLHGSIITLIREASEEGRVAMTKGRKSFSWQCEKEGQKIIHLNRSKKGRNKGLLHDAFVGYLRVDGPVSLRLDWHLLLLRLR